MNQILRPLTASYSIQNRDRCALGIRETVYVPKEPISG